MYIQNGAFKTSLPIVAFLGFVLVAPLSVFAQTSDRVADKKGLVYCPNLSHIVVRGSSGNQVRELQKFLSDYYAIPLDTIQTGYFGRLTREYVIRFQKEQGLPAFGIVGMMTRQKIASVCGCGAQTPCGSLPTSQATTSPKVTIHSLNSGEVVRVGQAVPISWTWEPNGVKDDGGIHRFTARVYLLNSDGKRENTPGITSQDPGRMIAIEEAKKNVAQNPWIVGKDAWNMELPVTSGMYKLLIEVEESCAVCDRAEGSANGLKVIDETDRWFTVE
jgi:peptidoglycan hydrolase-like protein with peptidoglycan-binding domain